MKRRFINFLKKLKDIIMKPFMNVLPGQLAFFLLLSIIPLVYLVALVGSCFSLSVNTFIEFIRTTFPPSTSNLIIPLISGHGMDMNLILFIISTVLLASNGAHSIIITSNVLYNINDDNYVKRRIKALFLTFMIIILLGFIIVVPAFGDIILNAIKNVKFINPIFDNFQYIFNILKYPVSFIFIFFEIKLIYTIAPDKQIKSSEVNIGALFTTFCWIIATEIYSYYVTTFVHYDIFYGSIANLIVLLLWIYLLSFIFVVGLALNASTKTKTELKLNKS
jgi:membrane protein